MDGFYQEYSKAWHRAKVDLDSYLFDWRWFERLEHMWRQAGFLWELGRLYECIGAANLMHADVRTTVQLDDLRIDATGFLVRAALCYRALGEADRSVAVARRAQLELAPFTVERFPQPSSKALVLDEIGRLYWLEMRGDAASCYDVAEAVEWYTLAREGFRLLDDVEQQGWEHEEYPGRYTDFTASFLPPMHASTGNRGVDRVTAKLEHWCRNE